MCLRNTCLTSTTYLFIPLGFGQTSLEPKIHVRNIWTHPNPLYMYIYIYIHHDLFEISNHWLKDNRTIVIGQQLTELELLFESDRNHLIERRMGTRQDKGLKICEYYQCYLLVLSRWVSLICSTTFDILHVRSAGCGDKYCKRSRLAEFTYLGRHRYGSLIILKACFAF
jgi:hypothetical protein